jgi:hypothetical protein
VGNIQEQGSLLLMFSSSMKKDGERGEGEKKGLGKCGGKVL